MLFQHCGKVLNKGLGLLAWRCFLLTLCCLSPVAWKKNNNVESPTSPEHRRPSKRVRISIVVRATDLGRAPQKRLETARRQVHQPISRLPPHLSIVGLIPACRWTVMGRQAQPRGPSASSCRIASNALVLAQSVAPPPDPPPNPLLLAVCLRHPLEQRFIQLPFA